MFILNPNDQGTDLQPTCKPKWLPNEIPRFSWDGSAHSTHNTAEFSDWLIFQNQVFSFITMLTLISQSLYAFSQQEFYDAYPLQIYTCHTSHILWKNLQAYNIEGRVQQEKVHKNQGACQALGIV